MFSGEGLSSITPILKEAGTIGCRVFVQLIVLLITAALYEELLNANITVPALRIRAASQGGG